MENRKERTVAVFSSTSKNNTFDGCKFNGKVEIDREGHKFIKSIIGKSISKHPFLSIAISFFSWVVCEFYL
jgi:hypothetical protein